MGKWEGKNNPRWNGGVKIHAYGYRLIASFDHPYKDKQGYVREHRLVMEKFLDRYLLPIEDVHHLNGNKQDNRIENLELISNRSEHMKKYHPDLGKKTRFKKGHTLNKKEGRDQACLVCGKIYWVPPCMFNHKFCSLPCYWQSKKGVAPAWLTR